MGDQDIPFERIGGYRILRRLATGGTSDVLLARAEGPHGFERTVVLKLLLQQFRREAPMEKMFAREAAAYARLSHPAIVKLYDFFSAEGQLVMVLEYVDGLPLNRFRASLRKSGDALDDRASIFVASRIFAALAAAHGARDPESGEFAPVIHRDVNPSNVLIPWDGHVKLADFGIAKVAGVSSDTQSGYIKGTYGYMAPEQVRGEPVTVRTDVYAASLLLWELLARRKAIQRGALPEMEVLRAMAEPSIPSLDVLRPDLPGRLREVVARGLEVLPDQRSVTAEEMLVVLRESVTSNEGRNVLVDMLARVRPGEPTQSKPPGDVAPSADATAKVAALPEMRATEPSVSSLARTALGVGQVPAVAPSPSPGGVPRPAQKQVQTLAFGADTDTAAARAAGLSKGIAARTLVGMSPSYQLTAAAPPDPSIHPPPPPIPGVAPGGPPVMPGVPSPPLPVPPEYAPTLIAATAYAPPPPVAQAQTSPLATTEVSVPGFFAAAMVPPAGNGPPPTAPMRVPLSSPPGPMPMAMPPAHRPIDPNEVTVAIGGGKGGTYALIAGVALVASAVVIAGLWLAKSTTAAPPAKTTTTIAPSTASTAKPPPTGTVATASAPAPIATAKETPPTPSATASPPLPTASAAPSPSATAKATPPTPSATAKETPAAAPPEAAPAAAIPAGMGRILTPAAGGSHRVFVDGRYAGDTPAPVTVKCGAHKVKIGSHGAERDVDVPCGQDVTLVGR